MIFASLKAPLISQVGEQVLLDASATYETGSGEITKIEILPIATGTYEEVSLSDKTIAWIYDTAGAFTATVRINDTLTKDFSFDIVTSEDDRLFSKDSDLVSIESEVMNWLSFGKSTYNDKHREAQRLILEELNARGLRDDDGNEITKENIAITKELNAWSRYLTLHLIYFDLSKDQNSVFWEKAKNYKYMAKSASNQRQFITVDGDGNSSTGEDVAYSLPFVNIDVVRR